METDLDTIIDAKLKPRNVWDEYCPIIVSEDGKRLQAYLTDGIDIPASYNELHYKLSQLTEDCAVDLYINNGGGIIDSALYLGDAMSNCKAVVNGHLSGTVASAATILTMRCDNITVAPFTQFLIHNYSGGVQGKGKEAKDQMEFVNNEINESFRDFYHGFLTPDEIEDVIGDHDIWLNSRQIMERWETKKAQK